MGRAINCQLLIPGSLGSSAFLNAVPTSIVIGGNFKWPMGPTQLLTGQCHLVYTQCSAVTVFFALLVG